MACGSGLNAFGGTWALTQGTESGFCRLCRLLNGGEKIILRGFIEI
jgi:hypothetical protein